MLATAQGAETVGGVVAELRVGGDVGLPEVMEVGVVAVEGVVGMDVSS